MVQTSKRISFQAATVWTIKTRTITCGEGRCWRLGANSMLMVNDFHILASLVSFFEKGGGSPHRPFPSPGSYATGYYISLRSAITLLFCRSIEGSTSVYPPERCKSWHKGLGRGKLKWSSKVSTNEIMNSYSTRDRQIQSMCTRGLIIRLEITRQFTCTRG